MKVETMVRNEKQVTKQITEFPLENIAGTLIRDYVDKRFNRNGKLGKLTMHLFSLENNEITPKEIERVMDCYIRFIGRLAKKAGENEEYGRVFINEEDVESLKTLRIKHDLYPNSTYK